MSGTQVVQSPHKLFEDVLCGDKRCKSCRQCISKIRIKDLQKRRDTDHNEDKVSYPKKFECIRCELYFRKEFWRDTRPHRELHKTFSSLEESALLGCPSCRLFRQAIMYDLPTSTDVDLLRTRKRPVWVLAEGYNKESTQQSTARCPSFLTVEYGAWPYRSIKLDLVQTGAG